MLTFVEFVPEVIVPDVQAGKMMAAVCFISTKQALPFVNFCAS
jgi:hypothetical protein